jgi:hypothetical protein
VAAEVAVAVRVCRHHRCASRHGLQQREAESLVNGGLNEDACLVEELVHPLVAGALEVTRPVLRPELGLHAEHPELGLRIEPPPGLDRERQVLERQRPPDGQDHVLALGLAEGTEVAEVDPGRDQLR